MTSVKFRTGRGRNPLGCSWRWGSGQFHQMLDVFAVHQDQLAVGPEKDPSTGVAVQRFGFSYYIVSDADLETFAPIVARLAGS